MENESCQEDEETEGEYVYFGDGVQDLLPSQFRIGSNNIDNLPVTCGNKNEDKNGILFKGVRNYQLDITLLQELGVNWSVCSKDHQSGGASKTIWEKAMPRVCAVTTFGMKQEAGSKRAVLESSTMARWRTTRWELDQTRLTLVDGPGPDIEDKVGWCFVV